MIFFGQVGYHNYTYNIPKLNLVKNWNVTVSKIYVWKNAINILMILPYWVEAIIYKNSIEFVANFEYTWIDFW